MRTIHKTTPGHSGVKELQIALAYMGIYPFCIFYLLFIITIWISYCVICQWTHDHMQPPVTQKKKRQQKQPGESARVGMMMTNIPPVFALTDLWLVIRKREP